MVGLIVMQGIYQQSDYCTFMYEYSQPSFPKGTLSTLLYCPYISDPRRLKQTA